MLGTSLMVQQLRIHLPTWGTQVRSLVGQLRTHMLGPQATTTEPAPQLERSPHAARRRKAAKKYKEININKIKDNA